MTEPWAMEMFLQLRIRDQWWMMPQKSPWYGVTEQWLEVVMANIILRARDA